LVFLRKRKKKTKKETMFLQKMKKKKRKKDHQQQQTDKNYNKRKSPIRGRRCKGTRAISQERRKMGFWGK